MNEKFRPFYVDTKAEFLEKLNSGEELPDGALVMIMDTHEIYFNGEFFGTQLGEEITMEAYNELVQSGTVDPDKIYFIVEDNEVE